MLLVFNIQQGNNKFYYNLIFSILGNYIKYVNYINKWSIKLLHSALFYFEVYYVRYSS